jgi:hypothetical protein
MAIQIGKYKRPGIFLEEFDNSIIATPVVEGITNLVIGVSKKGPVNTPVRINTLNDLERIFGPVDRSLERKGSYFHRTVAKMLESSPVFAMNLLVTSDTLDTIEYKSVSSSAGYSNDIERLGAYRKFHDVTGFWKRDTEAFINLTKSNTGYSERAFSFTNLSDRYATIFIFNTKKTGFDRTLIEWYGTAEKVPPYVNPKDYASDYMVDVLVVSGDWSDYRSLSLDTRWSKYFNANGLRKDQTRNFANDTNVSTLAYYEGLSLIPYFRDSNGRNIFIETNINRDTDRTGIFCAFNNDLVEADYYNGMIDVIGQTIAGVNKERLDFLSYSESITEEVDFSSVPLDLPGNVTALLGTFSTGGTYSIGDAFGTHTFRDSIGGNPRTSGVQQSTQRTAFYSDDFIRGVYLSSTASVSGGITMSAAYTIADPAYAIFGGSKVDLVPQTVTMSLSSLTFASFSATQSLTTAYVLDNTGSVKAVNGTKSGDKPALSPTDMVLGYVTYNVRFQRIQGTPTFKKVYVDYADSPANAKAATKYIHLNFGTDYTITNLGNGSIKVTFLDTDDTPTTKNYEVYRRFKAFNRLVSILDNPNKDKVTMLLGTDPGTMNKWSLKTTTISEIVTTTTSEKSFVLNTGLSSNDLRYVLGGLLVFYTEDNEFILGTTGVQTSTATASTTMGVVAKYSDFYSKFYDGYINTGDFFYNNRITHQSGATNSTTYDVKFVPGEHPKFGSGWTPGTGFNTGPTFSEFAGNDYIVFEGSLDPGLNVNDVIRIKGASTNTGDFTIVGGPVSGFGTSATQYAYQVNENTTLESVSNVSQVYKIDEKKHYLKMYVEQVVLTSSTNAYEYSEYLYVTFNDNTLTTSEPIVYWNENGDATPGLEASANILVHSADTNFKQTLEIEAPIGYTEVPNKVLIRGARYTEVTIGDFLDAEYDASTLATGEVARKMTRILSKKQYNYYETSSAGYPFVEITCDAPIAKAYIGGAYQTTRYKKVENYVETYKAISLKGFRIRQASLPDGTETKQNEILNLVAKGTPMFKALTNKEAFDFRYLIDSFGNGLTERSKQQLVDICGTRLDAFGFLNMPSMKAFKNSSSPSFVNSEGVLQAEFISKGADPESGPAFLYSFGDGPGSTCVGYFLPYLTVNDNGRPMDFPPASFVATTYMRKFISNAGGLTPWTIAAGVTNGRITGVPALEHDFSPEDIEWLNGAQMNPIVFKRNRGNVIETENTAQTLYNSALSYIHVREVLIELERELAAMLLDYQWRYNTPDVRSEIKGRADAICESYVLRNGLYNYFNKMDDENNTPEIIDNQIGVLDTYVEPIKGMGIIVNNVTILRTGAIEAGGFL